MAIFVIIVLGGGYCFKLIQAPLVRSGKPAVIIRVAPNTSARSLINLLSDKKLIKMPELWLLLARLCGFANHLKAGYYQINPGDTGIILLHKIVNGAVVVESFRIIEGTTSMDVRRNLTVAPYLNYDTAVVNNMVLQITQHHLSEEGLLLAATYFYNAGSAAQELLWRAHIELMKALDYYWRARSDHLPYTNPYEMLVAASIIEKETALDLERKIISGIIVNRINLHMPLQMDPTVMYIFNSNWHNISRLTHQNLSVDSPYNTYLHRGLPPTPIAIVGKAALEAAAHPLKVDYLYFYANSDGSHKFSKTYREQQKAIRRQM